MEMQIDVARLVGAVTREVSTRDLNGKPARVLVASRAYDTSAEELWDALVNAERLQSWFMPISGDLHVGGRYQLEGNAGGEITKCDPPRHLGLSWEFGGDVSWVAVELGSDSAAGTRLRLEHIGHTPDEFWTEYGPGAAGVGWEQALMGLELHLSKEAVTVTPEQAEAWLTTDDGKSFIRECSEAWGDASVAAGTDASAAKAAAQRTTKFYSG